jgi:uncharacterized small protein (DUF1192 family)
MKNQIRSAELSPIWGWYEQTVMERGNDMDELDDMKSQASPKAFIEWNVEDLEDYIGRLKAEIQKVEAVIADKKSVSSAAEALFKS